MSLVLDASVVMTWVLEAEVTRATDELMDRTGEAGAVVPALWRLEVANVLQMAVRRKRMTAECRDVFLRSLEIMPIEIDDETNIHAWATTLTLADRHGLTTHDAAYLELARRRRLPLASLDADLRAAAERVSILPA